MVKPFLKWAGGKTQLIGELLRYLPPTQGTYFEPFVGGGSLFWKVSECGRCRRAVINDVNPELTNLYQVVRDRTGELIDALTAYQLEPDWNTEAFYKAVRSTEPEGCVERAARMVYLNRTGFNGLHRVNKAGKFNVPFGRYNNPQLYNADNLWACRRALADVEIRTGDFNAALSDAIMGDVVYIDPPYVPLSKTSNFTAYAGTFGTDQQQRLAQLAARLVRRGVFVVASNSDTPAVHDLYRDFQIVPVEARRTINSDPTKRGKVRELLLIGRPPSWPTDSATFL